MASTTSVQIVSHIDITQRFKNLDEQVQEWEKFRNPSGGFDLELGEPPSTLMRAQHVIFYNQ